MSDTNQKTSLTITWTDASAKSSVKLSLEMKEVTIGRAANGITIQDEFASRVHAVLYRTPKGELRVRDNGSTNGTFLNRQRVEDAAVRPGDELRVGHTYLHFVATPSASQSVEFLRNWPNQWSCIPKHGQEQFSAYLKNKSN